MESEKIAKKKSIYIILIIIAIIVVAGLFIVTRKGSLTGNVIAQGNVDNDASLGNKNAPVTIVEFSDFQCPFCRKANNEALFQVRKNYVETGKVRLVFRDFPLDSIHPAARPAAIAAECVREQGSDEAFWKMHDKIFEEQNKRDSGRASGPVTKTISFTEVDLKAWAQELGYDIGSCLDSRKYNEEIDNDIKDGQRLGVKGTPAFLVNGKLISGAQPYDVFRVAIEEAPR